MNKAIGLFRMSDPKRFESRSMKTNDGQETLNNL